MRPDQVESLQDLPLAKHHFTSGNRETLDDYMDLEEELSVE